MSRSESRILTRTFAFRMSPGDAQRLIAAAEGLGVEPGPFVRSHMLRILAVPVPARRQRRTDLAKAVAAHLGLLGRIASSLNQLAKCANSGGRVERSALVDVRTDVQDLTRALLGLREVRR